MTLDQIDAIIDECGMMDGPGSLRQARNLARAIQAAALEEAAKVAEEQGGNRCDTLAAAIRALK